MEKSTSFGGISRRISSDAEARLFLRLRARITWRTVLGMLQHARLRLGVVLFLSGIFWAVLYCVSREAFSFLDSLHAEVVPLLFNTFFLTLFVMLVFSTGILTYGGLYASPEAKLLLTFPARAESIQSHKFQEVIWFSGWGFALMGTPMLIAYGVVRESPWSYYLLLVPFMVSFVVIPASLGTIVCLAMSAWLPRLRLHAIAWSVVAGCAGIAWFGWSMVNSIGDEGITASWLEQAFAWLSITEHKLLPSWWISSGLIEAAHRGADGANARASLVESLKFLALLVSNALLLRVACDWLARQAYRLGYSQVAGDVPSRRQLKTYWLDDVLSGDGASIGRPLRLLLVKDFRIFRRDITQWSQCAIFFGLLALYFFNLRSFNFNAAHKSVIGFLNLAVVGLILSTFTTRFVYPMISLEGRRFWILGLLPVHRDQVIWSKFLFSFVGGLIPCMLLVLLSDTMLGIPKRLLMVHEICCLVLCMGLSGIAVGFGAKMPELRESSPTKIAAGFGGTLTLVLSSLFIVFTVVVAALPSHLFQVLATTNHRGGPNVFRWAAGPQGIAISVATVTVVGLLVTFIPMVAGLRSFRRLEP
ncbi:MAG: putative ABC transporter permease subunit [Planctomycetia bacterium]